MGITVNITFSTPLSEEDDDILAGTAYWLMATANRNGRAEQVPPTGCGVQDPARPTFYCVGASDHEGRHTYRDFGDGEAN